MMMLLSCTSDQDAESALKELMLQLSSVWPRMVMRVMIMVLMMMLLLLCTPDQDAESALKEMMPH